MVHTLVYNVGVVHTLVYNVGVVHTLVYNVGVMLEWYILRFIMLERCWSGTYSGL